VDTHLDENYIKKLDERNEKYKDDKDIEKVQGHHGQ